MAWTRFPLYADLFSNITARPLLFFCILRLLTGSGGIAPSFRSETDDRLVFPLRFSVGIQPPLLNPVFLSGFLSVPVCAVPLSFPGDAAKPWGPFLRGYNALRHPRSVRQPGLNPVYRPFSWLMRGVHRLPLSHQEPLRPDLRRPFTCSGNSALTETWKAGMFLPPPPYLLFSRRPSRLPQLRPFKPCKPSSFSPRLPFTSDPYQP